MLTAIRHKSSTKVVQKRQFGRSTIQGDSSSSSIPGQLPVINMCKYYAHSHPCGHVKTVFAAFCPQAALVQKPCGRGDIWATVKMEKDCTHCYEVEPPAIPRSGLQSRTGGGRKKVIRR
ncbi:uncharacterized protein MYCFIDRAFT_149462 [Pseudocercospora fijiensis CIRAD86]|uniref:Uncharacterized protein n=1 Tax=Pseudocercospora fijiensis (strain CIRAD86) TaxID=383855 RepID=N1QC31_PSEFD|nr:uncharacterized protein MYCFIDRAFT_149462 [Pseudocercospora fijiensis CIRAD86]EME88887.1 hypothetical protein MYCFIDRAFT_149462 [Pseudocercospora fijiensis CIRAD86]